MGTLWKTVSVLSLVVSIMAVSVAWKSGAKSDERMRAVMKEREMQLVDRFGGRVNSLRKTMGHREVPLKSVEDVLEAVVSVGP